MHEGGNFTKTPPKSLENLKETFKQRLDGILNAQLTVGNIETFATVAFNKMLDLNENILEECRNNPNIKAKPNQTPTKEQEDEVYETLGLPNIKKIIEIIIEKENEINSLKDQITKQIETSATVITPPENNGAKISSGNGENKIEKKKLLPRLLTLMYILEHDFDIKNEEVKILEGKVTPDMVRRTPYARVEIPDLGRVVYVCNEEGNVSYIFDSAKLTENGFSLEEIDLENKGDKNSIIERYPGIGARFIQTPNWRNTVAKLLNEEIPQNLKEILVEKEKSSSEFKERKRWSIFEDFQTEVREFYPGKGDIYKWYHQERKNHPNWSSHPHDIYKEKGWIGWSELIGKENFLKKEWLPFGDFQNEVRELYPGKGDIQEWYRQERKNHPTWPSHPHDMYKEKGWVGWPELVDIENFKKKEWLPFGDFQNEVRELYPGKGDIQKWYHQERENHSNWPSNPKVIYKNNGWVGWPELVGIENIFKKEYLSFEDFQAEVRKLYPGKGDVYKWYHQKIKNHPDWPSHPERIYMGKGWLGWPELVGIENFKKKEYLSFMDFQAEVRKFYLGESNVHLWYIKERNDHHGWPYEPNIIYKEKGWIDWSELVGKENIRKKEYLSFDNFQAEIRELYPGSGDVRKWYLKELKNHSNWPYNPDYTYKEKGWMGWSELAGVENFLKKEWLSFEDFQTAVREIFPGKGGIQKWYIQEQKKHPNWPSNPERIYRGKGWTDWYSLVGKK